MEGESNHPPFDPVYRLPSPPFGYPISAQSNTCLAMRKQETKLEDTVSPPDHVVPRAQ
jgi:hypothetical protein